MLRALAEGDRDVGTVADCARGRLRQKRQELSLALEGGFSQYQRWALRQQLTHLEFLEGQVTQLETEIEKRICPYEHQIRLLVTIPGVHRVVACTILAELGPDMSVFPDARHAASWVGMCPGNRESAGKQMSGRTRKANPYLRRDLCQAAWAASHTKKTYLAALYRRFAVRRGHTRAIFAVAHQILIVAYQMLLKDEDYREQGGSHFDLQNKPKVVNRLLERLTSLGYQVTLCPALAPAPVNFRPPDTPPAVKAELMPAPVEQPLKRRPGRPCKCALRGLTCKHKSAAPVLVPAVPRESTPSG
jgi:hypothetical protein